MHHYIITGTSRGIGEALAYALIAPQNRLYCISRSDNKGLKAAAEEEGCKLKYYHQDLGQSYDAQHMMGVIMAEISEDAESVTLIHNAAVLSPIDAIGGEVHDAESVVRNVNVNLITPMLMTEIFVAHVQAWNLPKRVLNISSGAARKPKHAWSAYCSTKAGLDMFSRSLAHEQKYEKYPIQVVALAPGVVDTVMQGEIRETSEDIFREVDRFHQLKENGQLWSPDFVAEETIKLLNTSNFGETVIMDLRDFVG